VPAIINVKYMLIEVEISFKMSFTWLAIVSKRDRSGVAAGGLSLVVGTATPKLGTEATEGGATLPDSL
jgi:hypothetical protein